MLHLGKRLGEDRASQLTHPDQKCMPYIMFSNKSWGRTEEEGGGNLSLVVVAPGLAGPWSAYGAAFASLVCLFFNPPSLIKLS